jgi:hypothetical protein
MTGGPNTPAARSIGRTLTVPLTVFATYALEPSGSSATPFGSSPTGTSATRSSEPGRTSKNDTVSLSGFATARSSPAAVSASGWEEVGPTKRQTGGPGARPASSTGPASSAAIRVFRPFFGASLLFSASVAVAFSWRLSRSFVRSRGAADGSAPALAARSVRNPRSTGSDASSSRSSRRSPFRPFGFVVPAIA